ncbi:hypothetical protein JCM5353_000282 [Sporobolomyces roseus]
MAESLFKTHVDPTKAGFESTLFSLICHDAYALKARFDAVGKRIDELEQYEQLRCRITWATASKRWLAGEAVTDEIRAMSNQLSQSAQEYADASSIWRIPTLANFTNLILLYFVTAYGEITRSSAHYYLLCASQHFAQLYPTTESLTNLATKRPCWLAYQFVICELCVALERGKSPLLSAEDCNIFGIDIEPPPFPPTSLLLPYLSESPALLIDLGTNRKIMYIYLARNLANHAARPAESISVQEDLKILRSTWARLDEHDRWANEVLSLMRSPEAPQSNSTTTIRYAFTYGCLPFLLLEYSILDHVRRRLDKLTEYSIDYPADPLNFADLASISSLYTVCRERCQVALITCLRNARSRGGLNLLGGAVGSLCSISRFNSFTETLCTASLDGDDMVDRLASIAYFLETLYTVQRTYQADLHRSISSISALQKELQSRTGFEAERALHLYTATPPSSNICCLPEPPLIRGATSLYHAPINRLS